MSQCALGSEPFDFAGLFFCQRSLATRITTDFMSANNVESISTAGLDNPQKLGDGGPLSTVIEVPRSRHGIEKDLQAFAMAKGMSESVHAHPADDSLKGSQSSSVGPISNERLRERSPRPNQYRASITKSQGRRPSTRDEPLPMHNGHVRASMSDPSKLPAPKKRKKSGLGTVIRKIFGKRSVKNRISLPAPTENHFHVQWFACYNKMIR